MGVRRTTDDRGALARHELEAVVAGAAVVIYLGLDHSRVGAAIGVVTEIGDRDGVGCRDHA